MKVPTLFDMPPSIQHVEEPGVLVLSNGARAVLIEERDGPRARFLTGLFATWAALDRAGEGAKPLRAETERAQFAASAALTCLGLK